ncbi:prostatic acid phosphatase-like [Bombyx mandarina]|uniref:acid phosphatase n=1 Tax=Bombyx mandarina TaxID=7092 RepID=A0A6J2JI03_BOMMA|nr:prostatic acid phosphatase-like [Bombyx mandarina]
MKLFSTVWFLLVVSWCSESTPTRRLVEQNVVSDKSLQDTDLLLTFVVFRHGDRTPDQEELALFPSSTQGNKDLFYPYGLKALTNMGKRRACSVGKYLRKNYDGFLSRLYLPDEIVIRTTDYDRTKMTALTAMAGLYPPEPEQRWNPTLNWQPVPYNTPPRDEDDLLYYYNCPRYIALRDETASLPEIQDLLAPYKDLFQYLEQHTKTNITTSEDVFYLDNLFQTLRNVGVETPKWAQEVMPQIKEVTKIEYAIQYYTPELIRLSAGVLLNEILNATASYLSGDTEQHKARLYSAHENNVAAIMAAAKVFIPHQPNYGSTIAIEFRRNRTSGKYGFAAVYAGDAGGPGKVLSVDGCGGEAFCEYEKFVNLVQSYRITLEDFEYICPILT